MAIRLYLYRYQSARVTMVIDDNVSAISRLWVQMRVHQVQMQEVQFLMRLLQCASPEQRAQTEVFFDTEAIAIRGPEEYLAGHAGLFPYEVVAENLTMAETFLLQHVHVGIQPPNMDLDLDWDLGEPDIGTPQRQTAPQPEQWGGMLADRQARGRSGHYR